MTDQWMVVTVIVTLVGLATAIVVPLIKLNTTLTRLSTVVEGLQGGQADNTVAHERIWEGIGENTEKLGGHEVRITVLESK